MHGRTTTTEESETASGHRARLRQRLLDAGPQGFHDYELVEYLLALTIPRVEEVRILFFECQEHADRSTKLQSTCAK